jgi:hypothetical protein
VSDRGIIAELRSGLLSINPDVSHRATEPPDPSEIYTPSHHISALNPDNSIVVGIRGAGKSFWAGALGGDDAREVVTSAYPELHLERYLIAYGFTGFEGDPIAPSPDTAQQYTESADRARLFWRIVVFRALGHAAGLTIPNTYRELMGALSDPEDREMQMRDGDTTLNQKGKRLLLIFDALDTLSNDWPRLRLLTKALLEVTYAMRSYRSLRLKLFLRPEQLDDPLVGFTDLSKLKAGRIDLSWGSVDLYGLFFTRLANEGASREAFTTLARQEHIDLGSRSNRVRLPASLTHDPVVQERIFVRLAGRYMGSDHRKGKTYSWLPAHLADAFRMVTPRSFLTSLRKAAEVSRAADNRLLSIEGIKEGLREASRVRVDQLKDEYKWIELALAPLEGLRIPCTEEDIIQRWRDVKTTQAIEGDSKQKGYLAPSEMPSTEHDKKAIPVVDRDRGLIMTLLKIGVLERRPDGRINMPDIFRIGAALIGRGRVAPSV